MFENAETGSTVDKDVFKKRVPGLRVDLLNAQFDLRDADFSVLILIAGDDRLGCNSVVDLLNEWMDARHLKTEVFVEPSSEEAARPRFWRYWRVLPRRGCIGLYMGGWARHILDARIAGTIDDLEYERRVSHAVRFERALTDDGSLVLKFWLHLPRNELRNRIERADADPALSWQVDDVDRALLKDHDRVMPIVERYVRLTDRSTAPWHIIEGVDEDYRDLTIGETIASAVRARLDAAGPAASEPAVTESEPTTLTAPQRSPLDAVDLGQSLERDEYKDRLGEAQARLARLVRGLRGGRSPVIVFEGWDAAGKGGAIRRLIRPLPVRDYHVISTGAPNEEELARHYLWRFWRDVPANGRMAIFDRSWYGRVLVERVEGLASATEWRRAYEEINDFEDQLAERSLVVMKFWLHIDRDTQAKRFELRSRTGYKKYKLTDEDHRNRLRWDDYKAAANEMIARTSTEISHWHLVPANDKRFARVSVIESVCERLERLE
ncbi:MAG: polyphosphate:AMP phosphotransferase [Phycisphaerales bacterium]|jgi:polyphosphate:AMP phosphotransferase